MIAKLPKASIDHLGLSAKNYPLLLELVREGVKVQMKSQGFLELQL